MRRGTRTRLYVDNTFYAYGRTDGTGDIVIAAFNLDPVNPRTQAMTVSNIDLTAGVTDVISGTQLTPAAGMLTVSLPPLGAAVYVLTTP
jgi:hypothetical protein